MAKYNKAYLHCFSHLGIRGEKNEFLHLIFQSDELTCPSFPKTEILLNHILTQKLKEPGFRAFPTNKSN